MPQTISVIPTASPSGSDAESTDKLILCSISLILLDEQLLEDEA
jgi:hypothetical protein